jgi:hypothetical protein
LPDDDLDAAVAIAQSDYDQHHPDVVVGSSRGGAVAMNSTPGINRPARRKWGTTQPSPTRWCRLSIWITICRRRGKTQR